MTREAGVLWGAFMVTVAACLVFWLFGCTAEKKVEAAQLSAEAASCRAKISAVIQAAPSCGVAAAGVRQLVKEDPDCIDVFLGGHIGVRCRDGGDE